MWKNAAGLPITSLCSDKASRIKIEMKAREDAQKGVYDEPYKNLEGNYGRRAMLDAYNTLYFDAFCVRKERLKRMEKSA